MAIEFHNIDELTKYLNESPKPLVTIDGRDGAGKSTLGKQLQALLEAELIAEDTFRIYDENSRFAVDYQKLNKALMEAREKGARIILESCLLEEIAEKLDLQNRTRIYVKHINSHTGQWEDEEEVASERTVRLAIQKELDMVPGMEPSNFRIQMIEYHYRFYPHLNAGVIFNAIH